MKFLYGGTLSDEDRERLQDAAPSAVIESVEDRDEALQAITDAEAYVPGPWDAELLAAASALRWVQFRSAGVGRRLLPELEGADILITNASGVYGVPMAEHALALMFAFSRGLNVLARAEGGWRESRKKVGSSLRELNGATLGILGYGGVGRATAQRGAALGMRVLAVRRRPEPDEFADEVWGTDRLDDMLREADYLLVSCALTDETRGIIGARELELMKPTAVVVNVARGAVIDEEALTEALRHGAIAGAGLDVAEEEPLPDDSPLWRMKNVIITPHCSGASPKTHERLMGLIAENLGRYAAGEPLLNVVDLEAGY
ncbi:MAG: D-2-hydroxyacid dehydrogenase [Candidatus Brocadiia bacterium]